MKHFIKTRANDPLKFTTNMKEIPTSLGSNLYHYWNSNSEADSDVPVGIGFSSAFQWRRKWRESSIPITVQSKAKSRQSRITIGD